MRSVLTSLAILSISILIAPRCLAGLEDPMTAYREAAGIYRVKFKATIQVTVGLNFEIETHRIDSTALVRVPNRRGRTFLHVRQGANTLKLSGRITRLNYGWRRSNQHGLLHLRGPVTITSSSYDVVGLGGYLNLSALLTDRGVFPRGTFSFPDGPSTGRTIYGQFSHPGLRNAYHVSDLATAQRFRERARLEAERARLDAYPPRDVGGRRPARP